MNHCYSNKTSVLVVGGSGVIGSAFLRHIAMKEDITAIGLARRPVLPLAENIMPLKCDLLDFDKDDCEHLQLKHKLKEVTYLVYAAYIDGDNDKAIRAANTKLFSHALRFVSHFCPNLIHVTLMQGMKAYGTHLGPHKTPSQERDPRLCQPHFYYDQEDSLNKSSNEYKWGWSILRPHVVIGPALRSPMNLAVVIGVYATLCKEQKLSFQFPGITGAFLPIYQATDSGLLAKAIEWAGSNQSAWGQIFNITNGDFFRWCHMWPFIGDYFNLEIEGPADSFNYVPLEERFKNATLIWKKIALQEGLKICDLNELVSWKFGDYVFQIEWDVMADTTKCRQAGFLEFIDSEKMFVNRFNELRQLQIIP
jgi:nucleoside-diphosphate-sugar epimerase